MFFKRKKKQLPPPAPIEFKKRPSKKTKDTLDFFNGKKTAVDLLETDGRKKFQHSGHVTKERIEINYAAVGKWIGLAVATAFMVAVLYWGIKQ